MATDELGSANAVAERFLDNIETVVHGKREQIKLVVAALMCGGHALLEDVPGTAKTVLARAIAQSIRGAQSSRIQCTPDLQPTDVTGLSIFNQRERDFEFRPGPVFANVVLVDEINRAMPKTQSALLEAMAEQQVTVDGETRRLEDPFLVMATQNPIEYEGTFPLPEAQLDRFFVKTTLGYPDADHEAQIVEEQLGGHPLGRLEPVVDIDDIMLLRRGVSDAFVHEAVARWIVDLVRATRELDIVAIGSSVRGTLALNRAARAWAVLNNRRYVTPEDVEQLFVPVLLHRILFRPSFLAEIRDRGWDSAAELVRERCLEVAPKPGFDIDLDVPAAASNLAVSGAVFPLVPRRRVIGLAFGGVRSARRGIGSDVASTREYRPGDDVGWMDWAASAKLSAARGEDEFIVRERFADEAPRVVVLCDRRPSMSIGASPLRQLDKPRALLAAVELIGLSAVAARSLTGYLDYAGGEPFWRPPRSEQRAEPGAFERAFDAPDDTVSQGLEFLGEHRRDLPTQAFVFVVSDFVVPPDLRVWQRALEHRWEIVPVVIQDPVWERSFPDVGGITIPYADPANGRVVPVRLTEREAADRRDHNEGRWDGLVRDFRSLGIEPVGVTSHDYAGVLDSFLRWADLRQMWRGAPA